MILHGTPRAVGIEAVCLASRIDKAVTSGDIVDLGMPSTCSDDGVSRLQYRCNSEQCQFSYQLPEAYGSGYAVGTFCKFNVVQINPISDEYYAPDSTILESIKNLCMKNAVDNRGEV